MEELPFDFDSDDDDVDQKPDKKRSSKAQPKAIGKEAVDLYSLISEPKEPSQKQDKKEDTQAEKVNERVLEVDNNPELDTEAPVEHLSSVEIEAINQTLAADRLDEIESILEGDALEPEDQAAETFLNEVEASGDIETAYYEVTKEIGIDQIVAQNELFKNNQEEEKDDDLIPISPSSVVQIPHVTPQNKEISQTKSSIKAEKVMIKKAEKPSPSLGNIVDYLTGRREPRIKSKADIETVKNRLSEEIVQLQEQLAEKEQAIRRIVSSEAVKSNNKESINKTVKTRELRKQQISKIEKKPEDKVLVEAKAKPELANLKAQTMSKLELVLLAEKINIDGTNLRQVYEARLLGERGLRRVIAIYLRGGNVKRSLRRELIEKEIDFERDPSLRDQVSDQPIQTASTDLDSLLKKSGIDWTDQVYDEAPKKPSKAKTTNISGQKNTEVATTKKISDYILLSLIGVMILVIVALIINR